jgi:hypothetical protein
MDMHGIRNSLKEQFMRARKDEVTRLTGIRNDLMTITRGCSFDMHEPDNQGITDVRVTGWHLDNAMGIDNVYGAQVPDRFGELAVRIRRETPQGSYEEKWFNLADILALARLAMLVMTTIGEEDSEEK